TNIVPVPLPYGGGTGTFSPLVYPYDRRSVINKRRLLIVTSTVVLVSARLASPEEQLTLV
ncbi:hypothetical protein, partial [Celeribacter sp.]|uniref:hypothetical protein n=1 Tax=Celeribacter sp. TaxID=1890673 RepID=UPI003A93F8C5